MGAGGWGRYLRLLTQVGVGAPGAASARAGPVRRRGHRREAGAPVLRRTRPAQAPPQRPGSLAASSPLLLRSAMRLFPYAVVLLGVLRHGGASGECGAGNGGETDCRPWPPLSGWRAGGAWLVPGKGCFWLG